MSDNSAESPLLILKIISADLTKHVHETFGKMDPSCAVEWIQPAPPGSGATEHRETYSRTKTAWGGGKHPVWNHLCVGRRYDPSPSSPEAVAFRVDEDDAFSRDPIGRTAPVPVAELLPEDGFRQGRVAEFPLFHTEGGVTEDRGRVSVQALVVSAASSELHAEADARVEEGTFVGPVDRIGVSGGTAPFFSLVLSERYREAHRQSAQYYIGKDLSRAVDELEFYENIVRTKGGGDEFFQPLLHFTFEYRGILTTRERIEGAAGGEDLQLLVLRNLYDGKKSLRLLDIKMGEATSAKNWQGKSALRSRKQKVVDTQTNSAREGFRLEGFEGMPAALRSRDPLLDTSRKIRTESNAKKMRRMQLQTLTGQDIFMHFLDLHLEEFPEQKEQMQRAEYLEILFHEFVVQLTRLFVACQNLPVPQMWIGSSIALGFDCGRLPSRAPSEETDIRSSVLVKIFDWGRSELNTTATHAALSPEDRNRRNKYWNFYRKGIATLACGAALEYGHRFGTRRWEKVAIRVLDFDALTRDDVLGEVTVPVEETPRTTLPLGKRTKSTLTYSMSWHPLENSRLAGVWKVEILEAFALPNKDGVFGCSDPYCVLTATAEGPPGEARRFKQYTTVKPNVLNPVWNEEFELPVVAASHGCLHEALTAGELDLQGEECTLNNLEDLFGGTDNHSDYSTRRFNSTEVSVAWVTWVVRHDGMNLYDAPTGGAVELPGK
eukprot:CAMPEP_0194300392 /NCGR_PEP_ID=MMETSP0169-20130528/61230_1 /TAXON_ID=218684 /ORGANISM="Corethron pennatum, Strain L29A3" /LENGTH=718 /DNA_ID=CAMNT_0039050553 /DNA_START=223 /DNA_END=2380 /DNA_ORIENTATION=-